MYFFFIIQKKYENSLFGEFTFIHSSLKSFFSSVFQLLAHHLKLFMKLRDKTNLGKLNKRHVEMVCTSSDMFGNIWDADSKMKLGSIWMLSGNVLYGAIFNWKYFNPNQNWSYSLIHIWDTPHRLLHRLHSCRPFAKQLQTSSVNY